VTTYSAGNRFRSAVDEHAPLQVVGTINAYTARMAAASGHRAIYLSGGGVDDVLTDIRRITAVCELPLLVDVDTGFGGAFNIARTVRSLIRDGAAAMHMEDQVAQKRCGHRPGKAIVSQAEMVDRIKAAVDARTDDGFVIMARTDALAVEGMNAMTDRLAACVEAGADMVFPEAVKTLEQYTAVREATGVPVLANITEFGHTPLFTTPELGEAGVDIVLYCCSAYRAMNKAALTVYQALLEDGHQKNVLEKMQTREELYQFLGYHDYEQKLDELFSEQEER
jgi:methylisocitrate lyase